MKVGHLQRVQKIDMELEEGVFSGFSVSGDFGQVRCNYEAT